MARHEVSEFLGPEWSERGWRWVVEAWRRGSLPLPRRPSTRDARSGRMYGRVEFVAEQTVSDLDIVEGSRVSAAIRMQIVDQRAEAVLDLAEAAVRRQPEEVECRTSVHRSPPDAGAVAQARGLA